MQTIRTLIRIGNAKLLPLPDEVHAELRALRSHEIKAPEVMLRSDDRVICSFNEDGRRYFSLVQKKRLQVDAIEVQAQAAEKPIDDFVAAHPDKTTKSIAMHVLALSKKDPATFVNLEFSGERLVELIKKKDTLQRHADLLDEYVYRTIKVQCGSGYGPVAIDRLWQIFQASDESWGNRNIRTLYQL